VTGRLRGIAAAPGIAIGPAWRHRVGERRGEPLPDVRAAAGRAAAELEALADRVRSLGRSDEAAIFDAQALMAVDPALVDEAITRARKLGTADPDGLAAAVEAVARVAADSLAAIPDELLAARAADVRDVGSRIARIVAGRALDLPTRPSVAIADDLPPSVTAELPEGSLLGIALEAGSRVSHAVILARGLGIPAVVAVPDLRAAVDAAAEALGDEPVIAVDGVAGEVILEPDDADRDRLATVEQERRAASAAAARLRGSPGATADGHRIPLLANIGRPEDAARALEAGAEGVGLFRTEFVFIGRSDPPSEDEQTELYARVLADFGPDRPVVIRLADIGGDKPIPYLRLPDEANPFLGVRGLRLAWDDPALYLTQIRAIARAGAQAGVTPHLMAPMVSTVDEAVLLRSLVEDALQGLDEDGRPRAKAVVVGIMIEVPSAALLAPELARLVDFFSIGSNDLTQYVLAMDRTNPRLATVADALHPAVLRAIRTTVDGADAAGIAVAVCGELASDPAGALVLAGLGVDELSMDAGALDEVRVALSRATDADLAALANAALAATDPASVREMAAPLLGGDA
jgi:phosphoenolpyruvate-protein phosphotransferase